MIGTTLSQISGKHVPRQNRSIGPPHVSTLLQEREEHAGAMQALRGDTAMLYSDLEVYCRSIILMICFYYLISCEITN